MAYKIASNSLSNRQNYSTTVHSIGEDLRLEENVWIEFFVWLAEHNSHEHDFRSADKDKLRWLTEVWPKLNKKQVISSSMSTDLIQRLIYYNEKFKMLCLPESKRRKKDKQLKQMLSRLSTTSAVWKDTTTFLTVLCFIYILLCSKIFSANYVYVYCFFYWGQRGVLFVKHVCCSVTGWITGVPITSYYSDIVYSTNQQVTNMLRKRALLRACTVTDTWL